MKLQHKLAAYFILLYVIPQLVLAGLSYFQSKVQVTTSTYGKLARILEEKEAKINRLIENQIEDITVFSHRSSLITALDIYFSGQDKLATSLQDAIAYAPSHFTKVTIADFNSRVIASTDKSELGQNYYLWNELQENISTDTNLLLIKSGATDIKYRYIISTPLTRDGLPVAVLIVEMFAEDLTLALKEDLKYESLATLEAYLINTSKDGSVQYLTPLLKSGCCSSKDLLAKETLKAASGTLETTDYTNTPVLASFKTLDLTDWHLIVKTDKREAMTPVIVPFSQTVILQIVLGFLIVFLSVHISNSIVTPIVHLQKLAQKVSLGDWNIKVEHIRVTDELSSLLSAFYKMFSDIKNYHEKIQQQNLNLEKNVVERTLELNDKVAELERTNKLLVGRELKMAELKKELKNCQSEKVN